MTRKSDPRPLSEIKALESLAKWISKKDSTLLAASIGWCRSIIIGARRLLAVHHFDWWHQFAVPPRLYSFFFPSFIAYMLFLFFFHRKSHSHPIKQVLAFIGLHRLPFLFLPVFYVYPASWRALHQMSTHSVDAVHCVERKEHDGMAEK